MTIGLLRSVTETLGNYVSMEFGAESWRKVFGVHDLTPEEAVDQRVDLSWLLTTFAESMGIDADGFACGFGKYFFRCLDDPAFDERNHGRLETLSTLFSDHIIKFVHRSRSPPVATRITALFSDNIIIRITVRLDATKRHTLLQHLQRSVSLDYRRATLFLRPPPILAEKKAPLGPRSVLHALCTLMSRCPPSTLVVLQGLPVSQEGAELPDLANQGSFAGDSLRVVTPACVTWEFDELIRCTGNSTIILGTGDGLFIKGGFFNNSTIILGTGDGLFIKGGFFNNSSIILGTGDGLFIKGGFFKPPHAPPDGGPPQDVAIFQGTPLVLMFSLQDHYTPSLQDHSLYISDLNASDMLIELILASQELDESHHRLISLELEADLAMAEIRRDIHKAIKVLDRMIASSGSVSRQVMIEAKQALSGAENRLSNGRSSLSQCLALTSNMYDAPSTGLHSSALYEMQNQSISRVVGGLAGRVVEDDVKSSLLNLLSGVDCKDLESSSRWTART
eukprot:gene5286-18532_t